MLHVQDKRCVTVFALSFANYFHTSKAHQHARLPCQNLKAHLSSFVLIDDHPTTMFRTFHRKARYDLAYDQIVLTHENRKTNHLHVKSEFALKRLHHGFSPTPYRDETLPYQLLLLHPSLHTFFVNSLFYLLKTFHHAVNFLSRLDVHIWESDDGLLFDSLSRYDRHDYALKRSPLFGSVRHHFPLTHRTKLPNNRENFHLHRREYMYLTLPREKSYTNVATTSSER